MKFDATTLVALKRTEIQRLAKEYDIKANQKVNMRESCFFFLFLSRLCPSVR
jgi:hypothetical protein